MIRRDLASEQPGDPNKISPVNVPTGIVVPLHTPFRAGGAVDQDGIAHELRYLEEKGVEWVMLMGVTSEWTSLTFAERREIIEVACAVRGSLRLIFHVGAVSWEETLNLIKSADALSAQALMLSGPFVHALSPQDLTTYYTKLARSTDLPCLIYVNPGATVTHLSAQGIVSVANEANVVGMKDSARDPRYLTDVLTHVKEGFSVLCGEGDLMMAWLGAGAHGAMVVPALIDPTRCLQIFSEYRRGNIPRALELWTEVFLLVEALGANGRYLYMMKRALELQGRPAGRCRPPLDARPSRLPEERLASVMNQMGLLGSRYAMAR